MSRDRGLDVEKAQRLTYVALGVQFLILASALVFSAMTGSLSLRLLGVQAGVGLLVWIGTVTHMWLRLGSSREAEDRSNAAAQRAERGLSALFDQTEEGGAARGLRQWESVLAPALSIVVGLGLGAPMLWILWKGDGGLAGLWLLPSGGLPRALLAASLLVVAALGGLLMATYTAGLSRIPGWAVLRAGASTLMASTIATGLSILALAFAAKWSARLDRIVGFILLAWLLLQSV